MAGKAARNIPPTFSVKSQHVFLLLLAGVTSLSPADGHDFRKGECEVCSTFWHTSAVSLELFLAGLLVSYSSFVEVVDPETGDVWAKSKSLTENGLITGLTVRDAGLDQVTVLAVEMVNDTLSNLIQVRLSRDNGTARPARCACL